MPKELEPASERWIEPAGSASVAATSSIFPRDAVAVIYRPARSAMTSGAAQTKHWKLRFDHRLPRFIEPLMGWTGSEDTLAQVELTFPSAEAAIAYARRQGLQFGVEGASGRLIAPPGTEQPVGRNTDTAEARSDCGRPPRDRRETTSKPKVVGASAETTERSMDEPDHPRDLLTAAHLSLAQKRAILHRRALAAYQVEAARSNGEERSGRSVLDDAIDALLSLEEMEGCTLPRRFYERDRALRVA
jgi:hypothetical protein